MQYSPEAQQLKCIYCEAEQPIPHVDGEIIENDYEEWVERETRAPFYTQGAQNQKVSVTEVEEHGGDALYEVTCKQCGATTTFDPHVQSQRCPFCDSPLENNEAHLANFWEPNYVVPFAFSQKKCGEAFKKWIRGKWFAPNAARKSEIGSKRFSGLYLPFWTYDAQMSCTYVGERGERETTTDSDGNSSTTVRWYKVTGSVADFFDDVLVPAVDSIDRSILDNVTDWKVEAYKTYNNAYFAGFVTQIYTTDFIQGFEFAHKKMEEATRNLIRRDIGGDEQRIHAMDMELEDKKFKLLVLPFWVSSFRYKNKVYQVVVNGMTGKVYGKFPLSFWKIFFFTLLMIALLVGVSYLSDLLS